MKKVALVILHYQGKEFTLACLKSIEQLKTDNLELKTIVVNNNPQENLSDLKKKFNRITFLKTDKNLGYAGGNNFGIKRALKDKADYILLLNNDTTVDKNLILELVKTVENEGAAIAGPKIYFAPGYEYHRARYQPKEQGKVFWYAGGIIDWQNVLCSHRGVDEVDQGQYDQIQETDFTSGCAMLIKNEVLVKVGLFDNRYFLYLEDLEFCQRVKSAGFKIIYAPKAVIWHFNAQSSQVGGKLQDYFITRNRLLFGLKYSSIKTRFNLIKESIKLLVRGRPWQKIAVKDFIFRKFGQGSWNE